METFLNTLHTDIDLTYIYNQDMTFEEFEEAVTEYIRSEEIIYYYKAMELLQEHDPSLNHSLELASELGYTTDNINSELLATLLYQDILQDEWFEIRDEVQEKFEELEEELNETF